MVGVAVAASMAEVTAQPAVAGAIRGSGRVPESHNNWLLSGTEDLDIQRPKD
jgi:hypothetical protein